MGGSKYALTRIYLNQVISISYRTPEHQNNQVRAGTPRALSHRMSTYFSRLAILGVSVVLAQAVVACAAADDADEVAGESSPDGTDNNVDEADIVSEGQLYGRDLGPKQLALTFDDGPGERTSELSAYLKSQDIPAAFFINGKNVPGRQRVLSDILRDGHLLANHTQNHVQLTKLSAANAVKEVVDTDNFIKAVQPGGPWLLRPPFGAWSGTVARAANAGAMSKYVGSIFWDIGGQMGPAAGADWACWSNKYRLTPTQCGDLYVKETRARNHGIVLLHDVHSATVDMVKKIVPILKAEGYTFVALTAVPNIKTRIGAGGPTPGKCFSSTLSRSVGEGACVQAARDSKWYVCQSESWNPVASSTDAACLKIER
jgi:peptidoglycan-N-acetylglucosamine deacetylase